MKYAFDAIYENGAFRPLQDGGLGITDGQRVRITVENPDDPECLQLATRVFDGLSKDEIDEVQQIALRRSDFFGRGNHGA